VSGLFWLSELLELSELFEPPELFELPEQSELVLGPGWLPSDPRAIRNTRRPPHRKA